MSHYLAQGKPLLLGSEAISRLAIPPVKQGCLSLATLARGKLLLFKGGPCVSMSVQGDGLLMHLSSSLEPWVVQSG